MSSWIIIIISRMCDVAIKEKEQQSLLFHKGYSNYRGNVHPSLPIPDIIIISHYAINMFNIFNIFSVYITFFVLSSQISIYSLSNQSFHMHRRKMNFIANRCIALIFYVSFIDHHLINANKTLFNELFYFFLLFPAFFNLLHVY